MKKICSFILFLTLVACSAAEMNSLNPDDGFNKDENPPLSQSETVLYFGDSHTVGSFGSNLENIIKTRILDTNVFRFGISGSRAPHWSVDYPCPAGSSCGLNIGYIRPAEYGPSNTGAGRLAANFKGLRLLELTKPFTTVIIALGTNDLAMHCRNPQNGVREALTLRSQVLNGQKCFWVGPPHITASNVLNACGGEAGMARFRQIYQEEIEKTGCRYIDSTQTGLLPNAGDGLHFFGSVAAQWAEYVYSQLIE